MKRCATIPLTASLIPLCLIVFGLLLPGMMRGGAAIAASSDEQQIRQIFDDWKRAFETGDIDGIMKMYAHGDELVSYDVVPPLQYNGYDAYKKDYQEFLAMFDGHAKVEILDVSVLADKKLAYAHGTERMSGTLKGGEKFEATVRWTEVFRKIDGRWKVVHEHISAPIDLTTGKGVFDAK